MEVVSGRLPSLGGRVMPGAWLEAPTVQRRESLAHAHDVAATSLVVAFDDG